MQCLLCPAEVARRAASLETHVIEEHRVARSLDLVISILILGEQELSQMTADLASRLQTFRSSSCMDNEADESNNEDTLSWYSA